MSEVLSAVQDAFQQAVRSARELSVRAPGSITAQALSLGIVVGAISYLLFKKRYRLPPGPLALPLVGNLLSINNDKEPYYMTLAHLTEKYGPVIMIYLGPIPCVTLNRVDTVMEALVKKGHEFSGRPRLYSLEIMSNGYRNIIFADEHRGWKIHRKIAVQALRHYMSGSNLETAVHDVVGKAMDIMASQPGPFNPRKITTILMFVLIDMFCFGARKEFDDPKLVAVREIFDRLTSEVGNGFLEDIFPPLRYFPTKKFRSFVRGIDQLVAYITEAIDKHRKDFTPDSIHDITDSILLAQMETEQEEGSEVKQYFTNAHVVQTVFDIFGGGVDTSRMTLDWGLYFIASFPQVQKRMQKEIDAVTGSRMPGLSDRPTLPYTEATLYEIMRLGTVVPLGIPHRTTADTTVGGYEIPKGTTVMINHWALLHDPKQWENADAFQPERFLDDQGRLKTRPESWLPFSAGRRSCLGENVAKPELMLIFACIVKRFTLSLAPGSSFNLKPKDTGFITHLPEDYEIIVKDRSA